MDPTDVTTNSVGESSPPPQEKHFDNDLEVHNLSNMQNHPVTYDDASRIVYLVGLRFWLVIVAYVSLAILISGYQLIAYRLSISVFLTSLEIPIVTTSLVAIANDLGEFNNLGWVISSYLLGYVGVLVIFAKLSDILGRKLLFTISISLFIIFSAACGAAQT